LGCCVAGSDAGYVGNANTLEIPYNRRPPLRLIHKDKMFMTNEFFSLALLAATVLSAADVHASDPPATDLEQRLEQQVSQMQQQLDAVKAQLQQLKAQNEALAAAQQQQAVQAQASPTAAAAPAGGISPNLSLWGYGEVYYTHPLHDASLTEADLARAVFGIGYRFDDRTIFNSEFEVEHAIASADDKGEFEVEQFYIDHQLADGAAVKAGLFLMPFGLLNEHHEPTNFYGVQRNFVETLIIPSTWREGGVGFHGNTSIGLGWDVGLTTGFNLAGWNNNPEDPQYRTALQLEDNDVAPLQATHQELELANAQHLSQYVALNYSGVPGLLTGAAIFTGKAALPPPAGLPDERVTLWEAHARWTPGAADISAVYARGTISNTATYNLVNTGVANPLPSAFLGYYLQGAYTLWQQGGYRFSPFIRWEHYDMGASYEGIAPGFTTVPTGLAADGKPWPQPRDSVWTLGASFFLNPHVVFKADYQHFDVNSDFTRLDLGLGVSF
jgi:hypothetical protein